VGIWVLYWVLVICNALVIAAALKVGPRMGGFCRWAAFGTGLALMVFVIPIVNLVVNDNPPPQRWEAVGVLVRYALPLLGEFWALMYLWKRAEGR
jgi:hypothetical protein